MTRAPNGVSNEVPWGGETTCSWKLHHDCSLPTSSDVHDRLSITYLVLVLHCSVYNDVKTVSDGGNNTVFEVDGRFLQILEY